MEGRTLKPYYDDGAGIVIYCGDALSVLRQLPSESVDCAVTSPPYFGLRDYGIDGQIGHEASVGEYVAAMVEVFHEVRRVLKNSGTVWLNIGDSYASAWPAPKNRRNIIAQPMNGGKRGPMRLPQGMDECKEKDLLGVPWALAFALRADGWYLRGDNIWGKPNGMPESVQDRPTRSHEYVFLLSKSQRYFYDSEAVRTAPKASTITRLNQDVENQHGSIRANGGAKTNGTMKAVTRSSDKQRGHSRRHDGFNDRWDQMEREVQMADGANLRSVWWIPPAQCSFAYFATMPERVAQICIKAGCPIGGVVLDPFMGSGTTALVAAQQHCKAVGIELNPSYIDMAAKRLAQGVLPFPQKQGENAGERGKTNNTDDEAPSLYPVSSTGVTNPDSGGDSSSLHVSRGADGGNRKGIANG